MTAVAADSRIQCPACAVASSFSLQDRDSSLAFVFIRARRSNTNVLLGKPLLARSVRPFTADAVPQLALRFEMRADAAARTPLAPAKEGRQERALAVLRVTAASFDTVSSASLVAAIASSWG